MLLGARDELLQVGFGDDARLRSISRERPLARSALGRRDGARPEAGCAARAAESGPRVERPRLWRGRRRERQLPRRVFLARKAGPALEESSGPAVASNLNSNYEGEKTRSLFARAPPPPAPQI